MALPHDIANDLLVKRAHIVENFNYVENRLNETVVAAGAWNNFTNYKANNLVSHGGQVWKALRPNINVTPVEGADWTLWLEKGAPGAQGPAGTPLRFGNTVPANSLGVDGDFYLRLTTGDFYLKQSGAYSIAFNAKGPPGDPGPDGEDAPEFIFGPQSPPDGSASIGQYGDFYIAENGDWYRYIGAPVDDKFEPVFIFNLNVSSNAPARSVWGRDQSTTGPMAPISPPDDGYYVLLIDGFGLRFAKINGDHIENGTISRERLDPESYSSNATADTLAQYSSGGRLRTAAPADNLDAVNLQTLIATVAANAGEANTASNLGTGTDGEALFGSKSGVDLRFKRLKAGANVTVTSSANSVTIAASGGGSSFDTRDGWLFA